MCGIFAVPLNDPLIDSCLVIKIMLTFFIMFIVQCLSQSVFIHSMLHEVLAVDVEHRYVVFVLVVQVDVFRVVNVYLLINKL